MSRYGFGGDQWFDDNGKPLSRGKLYFYEVGSSTPKATYSNSSLTTANTWPVVLDADGRQPDVFFGGAAKLVIQSAAGVQIDTSDPVYPVQSTVSVVVGSEAGVTVETWADLMLIESDTDFSTCTLLGFYAPGDGGGGQFYWDSTSEATPNIGTVVQPTATLGAGRWLRIFDGNLYPEYFGAASDGATDDSAAISAMFDAVRDSDNTTHVATVGLTANFKPGGIYRCDNSVNATNIRTLNFKIKGNGATLLGYCTGKSVLDMIQSRYCHLSDLYITGDEVNTPKNAIQIGRAALSPGAADLMYLENISTRGSFSETALYNFASESSVFMRCRFLNSHPGADSYCVIQDGTNFWNVTSDFVTITIPSPTSSSFNENVFYSLDARKTVSGPCIWMNRHFRHRYIGSYLVSYDDACVVLYCGDGVSHTSLYLDAHCETSFAPGLVSAIKVTGTAASRGVLKDFTFIDHACHASDQVFLVDQADGLPNGAAIEKGDIRLAGFNQVPINGIFHPKEEWELNDVSIYVDDSTVVADVNQFTGQLTTADRDSVTAFPKGQYVYDGIDDDFRFWKGELRAVGTTVDTFAGSDYASQPYVSLEDGDISATGNIDVGGDVRLSGGSTETRSLRVGTGRAGDGISLIDMIGDATYAAYGARLQRNAGANGGFILKSRGTGTMSFETEDAAAMVLKTNGVTRLSFSGSGSAIFHNGAVTIDGTASAELVLDKAASGDLSSVIYTTGSVLRWLSGTSNAVESGSNAGSDFRISRYTDAGAFIANALLVQRDTGEFGIGSFLSLTDSYAVASLPSGVLGRVARVNNATAPVIGSIVVGGGAANALVWHNGANWIVFGV